MSKEEKAMILEMVSEGKITPEEGIELLKAVGSSTAWTKPATPGKSVSDAGDDIARATGDAVSRVEEWAQRISDQGAHIGQVFGESGENIGKLISRLFTGGYAGGPRFEIHDVVVGEFPASGEIRADLATSNGRIRIETWDEPGFRLDVRKVANAASEEKAREMVKNGYRFTQDGLSIAARSAEPKSIFGSNYSIGFTLTLPKDRSVSLNLGSSNGRINVNGVTGGKMKVHTANGRLEIEDCRFSETDADTANGRIVIQGEPGDLTASTANGRIEARLTGQGVWKLNSANGRISAVILRQAGVDYAVDLSTMMGRLEVSDFRDAEVLLDDSKAKTGARRYKARTSRYEDNPAKTTLISSTANGRVSVEFQEHDRHDI